MSLVQSFQINPELIDLFNRLIKRKTSSKPITLEQLFSVECLEIDDFHEIDEKIRIALERKIKKTKKQTIDASALLTEGPFKGKSILWVSCYIGASKYRYLDEEGILAEGYTYLLYRILEKSIPSSLNFNDTFTIESRSYSCLWLAMCAYLKSVSNNNLWVFDKILEIISFEDLLKLDFNTLAMMPNKIAMSPLAIIIKTDLSVAHNSHRDEDSTHKLLTKIPPQDYPDVFNFNAPVLDMNALGMTTLCFAAQGEEEIVRKKNISKNSPFISILRKADLTKLDFNAKIRKGHHQGKTPLWYASKMLLHDDFVCFEYIINFANSEHLDFNAKPESLTDDANKSCLWLVSKYDAKHRTGRYCENIFNLFNDLTKLDFNNAPTASEDPCAGQTVLWNLGEAALQDKPQAFITALKVGETVELDYSARAKTGPHKGKSVLGLALNLALKENYEAIKQLLINIRKFKLNPDAIQDYELTAICEIAIKNNLKPLKALLPFIETSHDFLIKILHVALKYALDGKLTLLNFLLKNNNMLNRIPGLIQGYELEQLCVLAKQNHLCPLEILLPKIRITSDTLNRTVSIDNCKKNVLFLFIELTWLGYPHFMKIALKNINFHELDIDILMNDKKCVGIIQEIIGMINLSLSWSDPNDPKETPILRDFLESGYNELTIQMKQFKISSAGAHSPSDLKDMEPIIKDISTKLHLKA